MTKGSVVVLFQGAGFPAVEAISVSEVILAVAGFSALTNTGRRLCCQDVGLINVLDEHRAEGEYEVAPEAQALLDQTAHPTLPAAPDFWDLELL